MAHLILVEQDKLSNTNSIHSQTTFRINIYGIYKISLMPLFNIFAGNTSVLLSRLIVLSISLSSPTMKSDNGIPKVPIIKLPRTK